MFAWILNFFSWTSTSSATDIRREKLQHLREKYAVRRIERAFLKYKFKKELYTVLDKKIQQYVSKTEAQSKLRKKCRHKHKFPPVRASVRKHSRGKF